MYVVLYISVNSINTLIRCTSNSYICLLCVCACVHCSCVSACVCVYVHVREREKERDSPCGEIREHLAGIASFLPQYES